MKGRPSPKKGITKEMEKLRKDGLLCFLFDKPKPSKNTKQRRKTRSQTVKISKIEIPFEGKPCAYCGATIKNKKNKRCCSRDCARKLSKNKGRTAWNKGKPCSYSAEIGRRTAKKLAKTVTGRRISVREDGSRYWVYPEKRGET